MENAMLIAIVSIGTFAEYFFGVSNLIILQAAQATYVINIQNIFKTIINTICTAVFIYFGCSIYMVKLGSSIIFVILPAIVHFYVKKKYNLTNHCEPDSTGIQQRGAVAFHSLANILHSNTDIIVLTLFADVKEIAV
jgi:hypothetical protein